MVATKIINLVNHDPRSWAEKDAARERERQRKIQKRERQRKIQKRERETEREKIERKCYPKQCCYATTRPKLVTNHTISIEFMKIQGLGGRCLFSSRRRSS